MNWFFESSLERRLPSNLSRKGLKSFATNRNSSMLLHGTRNGLISCMRWGITGLSGIVSVNVPRNCLISWMPDGFTKLMIQMGFWI